jgi:hypothetical protein
MSVPTLLERIQAHLAKHPHDTATETAQALGVSRQRIHQAGKRYGLLFAPITLPALQRLACPVCGLEAWTRPGARLLCGERHKDDEAAPMQPAE